MTQVFYETSTKSIVLVDDTLKLQIETFKTPESSETSTVPNNIPHIHKSTVALHGYNVHVLDSIKSGTSERSSESGIYCDVLKPLFNDLFKIPHTYHATDSKHSVRAFAKSLTTFTKATAPSKPTLVIVISGDTSINELVNSLSSQENGRLKLFVVPAGTGNSLALSVGITDQARAISRLFTHTQEDSRPLNLYEANFPEKSYISDKDGGHVPITSMLFLVVASWAFHASLVADSDTEELRKYGLERFKMAAQQNLARPQKYLGSASVLKGGETLQNIDGPFAYFVLTPSQRFEPTFVISPHGNIFDTNMYLVSFGYQDNDSYILDIMGQVYDNGSHTKNSLVKYECLDDHTSLRLHIGTGNEAQNRRFCIDGAIVVVPEGEGDMTFRHFGSSSNGWDIEIIS